MALRSRESSVTRRGSAVTVWCVATLVAACGAATSTTQPLPAEEIRTPNGSGGINHPSVLERPHVVLVSFDGFRPDYLDRVDTPHFDRLARTGVSSDGLIPVFPSLTFPSHYSIATGLYPEHHGIVGNRFYDPLRGEEFDYRDNENARDGSWWEGEPIWLTAERQGMVAATLFFPGTEASIGDIRPTHWRPYDATMPSADRVRQVLDWLGTAPAARPHLIILYFGFVDGAGHDHGPENPGIANTVRTADRLLGQLLDGIDRLSHASQVYIVVVSDHGMAAVDPLRQIVLPEVVDLRGVRAIPTGPGMSLYVHGDEARGRELRDRINAAVSDAQAFLRNDIPLHLHHRGSVRIGDVLIVPEEGVLVGFRQDPTPPVGMHGWDPQLPSMHGIFLMRGPGLTPGQRIGVFENVHVYPLLASILELIPNRGIDGQLEVLRHLNR